MSFFQNPFSYDFSGVWILGDRQYNIDFKCPRNSGRGDELVTAWAVPLFNLSGNDADGNPLNTLVISFALNDYKNWADLSVTITGATQSAVMPQEVVTSLTSNTVFNDFFTTRLDNYNITSGFYNSLNAPQRVIIQQKQPQVRMRFYIKNGQAESVLHFNKLAGVSEMPTYFDRHAITNRFAFPDAQNALVDLTPTGTVPNNVTAAIINNAVDFQGRNLGFSVTNGGAVNADYILLKGRSGIFNFQKSTVDGSSRITQTISYPAGAQVGDLARLVKYKYTASETAPNQVTEEPYTLTSGDLVTP